MPFLDLQKQLERLDDPIHMEAPQGFDRLKAEKELEVFQTSLTALLGVQPELVTGTAIQDASFFAEIIFPKKWWVHEEPLYLRFSAFGRLVALNYEADLDLAFLANLRELLEKAEYVYVPEVLLVGTPWWRRYFDYL